MNYPKPSDMTSRDWHNYLVAQLVGASLGYLPRHAVALGVEPGTEEIGVHFQLTEVDEQDEEDMDEIIGEFSTLLGDVVDIRTVIDVRPQAHTDPLGPVRWIYRVRVEGESAQNDTP